MSEIGQARAIARDFVLTRGAPVLVVVFGLVAIVTHFGAFAALAALCALAWAGGLAFTPQGRADCAYVAGEIRAGLAALQRWNDLEHARRIAARDRAPAYWTNPPRDEDHADYRATWERLAGSRSRTDAEDATLVQVLRGLRHYGDDPLVDPPQFRAPKLFGVLPSVGPLSMLPLYAIGALAVLLGVQTVRVDRLKADADAWRSTSDGWRDRAAVAERNVSTERHAREHAEQRQLAEESRSLALANERDALQQRLQARERSRRNEAQSRTSASVVDYSSRLRELGPDPAASVPPAAPASAGGDSAGGMSAGSNPDANVRQ